MNHRPCCRCFPFTALLCAAFLATHLRLSTAAEASDAKDKPATSELSVPPSNHREFPEDRPAWIDEIPSRQGDIDRWPVTSTPCRSESLCGESLKVSMRATVETYIESITGVEQSSSVVTFDDQWIEAHRDQDRFYLGTIKAGDELMYESATVLRFDSEDRHFIEQRWRAHQVGQRLAILGAMSGLSVAALVGIAASLSMVTRRAELRVAR